MATDKQMEEVMDILGQYLKNRKPNAVEAKTTTWLEYILLAPFGIALVIGLLMWQVYAFYVVYTWFYPVYGLPVLSYFQCLGLMFLAGAFRVKFFKSDDRPMNWVGVFLNPPLTIAIGYVIRFYLM